MNYTLALIKLHGFVSEVDWYYRQSKHTLSANLEISNAMVRFAMDPVSDEDWDAFITLLREKGYLLSQSVDPLIFASKFIKHDT